VAQRQHSEHVFNVTAARIAHEDPGGRPIPAQESETADAEDHGSNRTARCKQYDSRPCNERRFGRRYAVNSVHEVE